MEIVHTNVLGVTIWELEKKGVLAKIFGAVDRKLATPAVFNEKNDMQVGNVVQLFPHNLHVVRKSAPPSTPAELMLRYHACAPAEGELIAGYPEEEFQDYQEAINDALLEEGYSLRLL